MVNPETLRQFNEIVDSLSNCENILWDRVLEAHKNKNEKSEERIREKIKAIRYILKNIGNDFLND